MGIGHLGLAFASKRFAPRASLGLLLLAGLFADMVMVVTLPLGLEHARIVPGITATMPFDLESIDQFIVGMLLISLPLTAAHFVDRHRTQRIAQH